MSDLLLGQAMTGFVADLTLEGQRFSVVDMNAAFGPRYAELPIVLRLLLENVIRHQKGAERSQAIEALQQWLLSGHSDQEIAFQPRRVLMHDTTSTPALVDIAAMRDVLAHDGFDPNQLNPCLPVDVSVDHSLAVEAYAIPDAAQTNLTLELKRNAERYEFLRWASQALTSVRVHPPGTGIMHTLNLEQLADVVSVEVRDKRAWLVPDSLIGTDSHTPMINGIGVLGWGVGGLEAQTVMFGLPTMIRIPEVVGVFLTGALGESQSATDLALVVTQRLRDLGVTGEFVEFYGPGVSTLTAGQRAVVANMAPEYGATTGYFGIDDQTLRYLGMTGRQQGQLDRIAQYARATGFWFDPAARPRYTRTLEIHLPEVQLHLAGPRRPQDLHLLSGARAALGQANVATNKQGVTLPAYPVAIAAITSCTNTSDPALLIAAGLFARQARRQGLRVPPWVKTSLSPGSPAAASYLRRAGLLDDLQVLGFEIVGHGCATCIGNSGPLTEAISHAIRHGEATPVAVLSGNRNFPGRVHPDLELAFILSPALVVAFALAGHADLDVSVDPIGHSPSGQPIFLTNLMPTAAEIERLVQAALRAEDFKDDFAKASQSPVWLSLTAPQDRQFPWRSDSTILRPPPFAQADVDSLLGHYVAHPLLILGDDVTTDHISPASAIPINSPAGQFLISKGDDPDDLNVFASRRGNWEVMVRAAFYNKTLVNRVSAGLPTGHTLHIPSQTAMPLWEAAQQYARDQDAVVIIAGDRYGMGSSRDWAAKGQRLLGVRSVLAKSFERIHRSNLIGMGILPLLLPDGCHPDQLGIAAGDQIEVWASPDRIAPRVPIRVVVHRKAGEAESIDCVAAIETRLEAQLLRTGGVIPEILDRAKKGLLGQRA
jgi:aconitate hydratase